MTQREKILLIALLLILAGKESNSEPSQLTDAQAIHCILGEARGEPYQGMIAVGEILRKRNSTQGMYGCNATFEINTKTYNLAQQAWHESKLTNITKGATMFENIIDFGKPKWYNDVVITTVIGNHTFFKPKEK